MARSHDPQKGPTHHIHWSVHTLAVSSFLVRKLFQLLPVKSCLVMAKAKHLAGFIDAPVYPGTSPAVAKLTSPREHPTAKGPPRGPKSSRWRGSRATPKARALHTRDFRLHSVVLFSGNSQQSERGDRLNQKCLSDSNGSRISKATAPFKSTANIRAETPRTWTLLTRLSGLR